MLEQMLEKLHIGQNTIFRGDINQVAGKLSVVARGGVWQKCVTVLQSLASSVRKNTNTSNVGTLIVNS